MVFDKVYTHPILLFFNFTIQKPKNLINKLIYYLFLQIDNLPLTAKFLLSAIPNNIIPDNSKIIS